MVLKLGRIQSPGGPTKKIPGSTVWFSDSVGLEWGQIIWISIKFLRDANRAGLGSTLGERGSKPHQPAWPCRGFNVHAESKWMLTQPSSLYGTKRQNSDTFFKIHLRNHFPVYFSTVPMPSRKPTSGFGLPYGISESAEQQARPPPSGQRRAAKKP